MQVTFFFLSNRYLLLSLSHWVVSDSTITWTAARQISLSFTIFWNLLKLMYTESVMPSNYFIFCQNLLLSSSIFATTRVFFNELVICIRWPKYWNSNFSISPPNEYSGLISFNPDWLDLLKVQGTLTNLLQHHSSKISVPQQSAFFIVLLSHPYMTIWKTIALIRRTLLEK